MTPTHRVKTETQTRAVLEVETLLKSEAQTQRHRRDEETDKVKRVQVSSHKDPCHAFA
jgi:hypothetical protein